MSNSKKTFLNKYFGDKAFYMMVLSVAVPIMVQNGITNFVSLLDNIMIGQLGTSQMSGAAIVNQLVFVFYLCIFGGLAGAGIFTAQYYGLKDQEGVQNTFRFKFWLAIFLTIITLAVFMIFGEKLINIYLHGDGEIKDIEATLYYGKRYLEIILWGLPAFALGQVYSSTMRECGETVFPMKAGIIAVCVNFVFNLLLIYGFLGFPKLGVDGAAIATVISRYVEVSIIVIWAHRHKEKMPFLENIYRTLRVPAFLSKKIIIKGIPLLVNETLWAMGVAALTQCYSTCGSNVIAGLNISNTINNLFNIVFIALGDSVAIIVGPLLGAGKMKEARRTDTRMITFSVLCCVAIGLIMFLFAPVFPQLYNTNAESKRLARNFIMLTAVFMPQNAFLHSAYFTLRSGGKTFVTFIFDSVFIWVVSVVIAFVLTRYTSLNVILIYTIVNLADLIKCTTGFILVKKGIWLNNIVSKE